jgi:hypothetical protein
MTRRESPRSPRGFNHRHRAPTMLSVRLRPRPGPAGSAWPGAVSQLLSSSPAGACPLASLGLGIAASSWAAVTRRRGLDSAGLRTRGSMGGLPAVGFDVQAAFIRRRRGEARPRTRRAAAHWQSPGRGRLGPAPPSVGNPKREDSQARPRSETSAAQAGMRH